MIRRLAILATRCGLALLFIVAVRGSASAQQQFQGVCSQVKIQILQELTLERIGFLATLEITNNVGDADFTDFSASLTFENPDLSDDDQTNDASELFFVQPPVLTGILDIDGDGILPPGQTATVEWFIIPTIEAGGEDPRGIEYFVGVDLGASVYGDPIAEELMEVFPDRITVLPEPQLRITYFQPRDVTGDNPFTTDIVEAPIPFTLGVLVENIGFGTAKKLKIESQQPTIEENQFGLLLVPKLIGSRVDDEPTDENSLTVVLGDIPPGGCRKGAWDMITTLSGEFTEFSATYTHADELGGEATSVIKELNAYFMAHEVLVDLPGRDDLKDFLACVVEDEGMQHQIPDTIFETDCNIIPVNYLENVVVEDNGLTATVVAEADFEDWVYMRVDDPGESKLVVASVERDDGKILNENNYWTNFRFDQNTNERINFLHILDYVQLGDYEYTVTYEPIPDDTTAPVTTIRFFPDPEFQDDIYYITEDTLIFWTVEDDSPVGIWYRLNEIGDFVPGFPFNIEEPGTHTIEYFSEDLSGNTEETQTATVVISNVPPDLAQFEFDTEAILSSGDSFSIRPEEVVVSFQGDATSARLDAEIEIFRGVLAWPTVHDVPSSPTTATDAEITVAGANVDLYRYRVNGGAWSADTDVGTPISLDSLAGTVTLEVNGRSQYGSYLPDQNAVSVSWMVSGSAPARSITGGPGTPTREVDATWTIDSTFPYRHQLDDEFVYLVLDTELEQTVEDLDEGAHTFKVGDDGKAELDENVVEVNWIVDRNYGTDTLDLTRVRHEQFEDIAGQALEFTWDGRDDDGVFLPAGWYMLRVTLTDQLGRVTSELQYVRIGDIAENAEVLSDAGLAPQTNLHARGGWAVWQDQRNDDWDIFAYNLVGEGSVAEEISRTPRNQLSPATDGRYVVWEDRQDDGTFDIWIQELGSVDPAEAVTDTPDSNERSPAVYWPWVVYRAQPVDDDEAPWQLFVKNLLTDEVVAVDPTDQDQLDPAIYRRHIVWQDLRDPGAGEIYHKNLKTDVVTRLTSDLFGQFHPDVNDNWVVWTDARGVELDIWGYQHRGRYARQLTNTDENESRPTLNGDWVSYQEDSQGVLSVNVRVLNLTTLSSVQLTNVDSDKDRPFMAAGSMVWEDERSGVRRVMGATLPSLVPVHDNRSMISVTSDMVDVLGTAHTLLELWNEQVGVLGLQRVLTLSPLELESVDWNDGDIQGPDFDLEAGTFLWVKFDCDKILDLGFDGCDAIDLVTGSNAVSYSCFPDGYSAYQLLRELGADVRAVRMLDSASGRWRMARIQGGDLRGEDFKIPRSASLLLEMLSDVSSWTPGG